MKKIMVLLLTLVTLSFSADKWEYCQVDYQFNQQQIYFKVYSENSEVSKYEFRKEHGETDFVHLEDTTLKFKTLNKMGLDGWEIVDIKHITRWTQYFLKRKID